MASAVTQTLRWITCPWWRVWSFMTSWRLSNANCTLLKIPCWGEIFVCWNNLHKGPVLLSQLAFCLHHQLCRYVLGYKGNASRQSVESRGARESGLKVVHVVTTSCSIIQLQSLLSVKLLTLCSSGETEIQVYAAVIIVSLMQYANLHWPAKICVVFHVNGLVN